MPTGSDFALVTDKKLLGVRDFDVLLLKYLRDYIGQGVKRLFIQGSFEERMPLTDGGTGFIEVQLKPTLEDGFAHDGAGHILDLGIDDELREAAFANVPGQLYEVGASYIEYPVGIRTNPRTGKFEYDRMREGIGFEAQPNSMTVDPTTLTFVVDSLFEQDVTVGDHSGRAVRVFPVLPGDAATSEGVAIEICTVFFDSGQNKIITTGYLGQSTPNNNDQLYVVQLIGVQVLMNTATNAPSQRPKSVFFIGTVEGNGGTPDTFDISGQNVIQAQSADGISVDPLPDWADGASNPGGSLQEVLEKIVTDLATSGEVGTGTSKIAGTAISEGVVQIPSENLANQLLLLAQSIDYQNHLRRFASDVNGFVTPEVGLSTLSAPPEGGGGRPNASPGQPYAVIYAANILYTHVRGAAGSSDTFSTNGAGGSAYYGVVWHEALGLWVVIGASGGNLIISRATVPTTGNFTGSTPPWTGLPGTGIAITDLGTLIIVGNGGKTAWSDDAITWHSVPSGISTFLTSVAHGNGITVAVGQNQAVRSDDEGVSWTSSIGAVSGSSNSSVYFFRGKFYWLARAFGNTAVLVSDDGNTWAPPSEFDNNGALDGVNARACVTPDAFIISSGIQIFAHPGGDEPWGYIFHVYTGSSSFVPIVTIVNDHSVAAFGITSGNDLHYKSWAR